MKKIIQNWMAGILIATTLGGGVLAIATPQMAYAAECSTQLLTFPAWYKGIVDGNCQVTAPQPGDDGLSNFIWKIALNVVEIILQLVAYITVGFIIFGGYKYMISAGSPDGMVKARKTITNALIGLVISLFSVAIVKVISEAIK